MADIKTWLETALIASGPAYALWRRAFYGVSLAAGSFIAAQQERAVTEKEAYEIGRLHVIKTAADFVSLRWAAIDWPAVAKGLDQACRDIKIHAYVAWKGLKRDFRLVRDFALRKRARKPHETVALLHEAIVKKEPIVEARALIGIQNEIGVLVQRGEARDLDETHRLVHLREQLRGYESGVVEETDGTGPQMQGLLSLPSQAIVTGGLWRWAIGASVAALAFLGLWRLSEAEKTPLKMKVAAAEQNAREFAKERDGWRESYLSEKQIVEEAHAQATQIAKTIEAERRDTAAAAARDRRRAREIQNVISGIGAAPSWSLRVDEPVTESGAGATPAPADTSGMPPNPGGPAASGSASDAGGSEQPKGG